MTVKGRRPDTLDPHGYTPLHFAAQSEEHFPFYSWFRKLPTTSITLLTCKKCLANLRDRGSSSLLQWWARSSLLRHVCAPRKGLTRMCFVAPFYQRSYCCLRHHHYFDGTRQWCEGLNTRSFGSGSWCKEPFSLHLVRSFGACCGDCGWFTRSQGSEGRSRRMGVWCVLGMLGEVRARSVLLRCLFRSYRLGPPRASSSQSKLV